jgi:hypothetical protein
VSALSHHLAPLVGLIVLVVLRVFFKTVRLAVILTAMAAAVLLTTSAHDWEALARMFGMR